MYWPWSSKAVKYNYTIRLSLTYSTNNILGISGIPVDSYFYASSCFNAIKASARDVHNVSSPYVSTRAGDNRSSTDISIAQSFSTAVPGIEDYLSSELLRALDMIDVINKEETIEAYNSIMASVQRAAKWQKGQASSAGEGVEFASDVDQL